MSNGKKMSLVLAVFNEEAVFPELYRRLLVVLEAMPTDYEIIFVDDGSRDRTLDLIREAAGRNLRIRYLSFSRNFGHQIALSAGIDHAEGDTVVVMDSDLQDPPEIIPQLYQKWLEGCEVVYAVRRRRKEGSFLKLCYYFYYRALKEISDVPIPPDAVDFCFMDRKVVRVLQAMTERNRYVRGIRAWVGFRQTGYAYERDKRFSGSSKYSMAKLVKLALDGITSLSHFPLRLSGYLGYGMALISAVGLVYSLASKFWSPATPRGWSSLALAIFFLGGVQLIMLSLVGSYVGRIYTEVQRRPLYIIRESGNFNEPAFGARIDPEAVTPLSRHASRGSGMPRRGQEKGDSHRR